jgi:predicted permease
MLDVLLVIAPLFLIIFASAVFQKVKDPDDNWPRVLNAYALNIGFPALIFSALSKMNFSFSEQADLLLANSLFLLGGFLLAYVLGKVLRLKQSMFSTLFICLAFGNVAYLGIPTLVQIAGEAILPEASLIVAVYLFWVFTVGIGFLDYKKQKNRNDVLRNMLMNLIKNPLLIAVVLGLVVSSMKVTLPEMVAKSLTMVAGSVTPVVLVVIGLFIGKSKIGKIKEWLPVFGFCLITLMVLPALFYCGLNFSGAAPEQFSSSIIEAAMPLAITPFALADKFKLHKQFIARSIVLSTILSVVTIPFWTTVF